MEQEFKFPCSGCGCCCKRLWMIIEDFKKNNFPYGLKADRSCEMLMPDNKCGVYDSRPDCCSVAKVYENNLTHLMTKKEFYHQNSVICNLWMEEDKVYQSLRIDLSQYNNI